MLIYTFYLIGRLQLCQFFFLLDVSRAANLQDDIIIWGVFSEELEHVQLKSSKQLKSRD